MKFNPPAPQAIGHTHLIEIGAELETITAGGEILATWAAVMAKILAACASGCFAENAAEARFGDLKLLRIECRGQRLESEFRPRHLHSYAAIALSNAVGAFHHQVERLRSSFLVVPDNWPPPYRPLTDRRMLPFTVDDDRNLFGRRMEITLSFIYPISAQAAANVEKAFGTWFSCVNLYAFSDDPGEINSSYILPGDDIDLNENVLSIYASDYLISEPTGIDGLLNVFCHVHHTIAPLSRVTFSD